MLWLFQVIDFSSATIAAFIAMVGILSIIAQVQSAWISFISLKSANKTKLSNSQVLSLRNIFQNIICWF